MSDRLKMIGDKAVLFVMAAEAEYGPHLQALFTPVMTGVGPVEAAVQLTATLAGLVLDGRKPDLVVSLGSAGSAMLEQAEVYQATSVSYRDMDASAFGFPRASRRFSICRPYCRSVSAFPASNKQRFRPAPMSYPARRIPTIDADMVEMETFAILRACHEFRHSADRPARHFRRQGGGQSHR